MACSGSVPTITTGAAVYDFVGCTLTYVATIDIPCGSSGYKLYAYLDPGTSPTFAHQVDSVALPSGPATYSYNKVVTMNCQAPGNYAWSIRIECDGVGTYGDAHGTFNHTERNPEITAFQATIDSDACSYAASAAYHALCGVPDATWTCEIYLKKGVISGLLPADMIAGPVAIPCGIGNANISANGPIAGRGTFYFTFVLKKNGVVFSTVNQPVECYGCDDYVDIFAPGNAVPYDDIQETIWLVKPVKSASGYTYEDQRLLSASYRMIDWFYYRNGGCGPFNLVLGESFSDLELALQNQWEIHVRIQLPTETSFTTWYRGIIRSGERRTKGTDTITEVRGQGYNSLLAEVYVGRRYPKGLRVDQIVADIITNYVKPNTKIKQPRDIDPTLGTGTIGTGIDQTTYVTRGPIHFECSALKAIKFLSELEGGMEFGVAANNAFFFRAKNTDNAISSLFAGIDVTSVVDAGKEVQKINQVRVEGKGFGKREFNAVIGDPTDITLYGLFERQIEVPWIEQQDDAVRWSTNIIALKRDASPWKTLSWDNVNTRLESAQPLLGMQQLRFYSDPGNSSTKFNDYDINKIHYYKGLVPGAMKPVQEMRRPIDFQTGDNPQLRAVITTGYHHHDLVEELEEKVFDQIGAIKGKLQQFRNPFVDPTLPLLQDVSLNAGELQGMPNVPGSTDVTAGPILLHYFDGTLWRDLISMKSGEQLPASGVFVGEEFFKWSDGSHTTGVKYYWTGSAWSNMSGGGGGGGGDIRSDGTVPFAADESMGGHKLTGVAAPVSSTDAANKQFVLDTKDSIAWKDPVRVATTAALTLSSVISGTVIDGFAVVTGDRVLFKDQAAQAENGIYIIQTSSTPVRSTDADTTSEMNCAATAVRLGTVNKSRVYLQTTDSPTIGSSAIVWTRIDGAGGGGGGDIKSDGTIPFAANESMGGFKLTNVGAPTSGTDAANRQYVLDTKDSIAWKDPVRAASTAALTLSSVQNGTVVDGVTLATGDRFLFKDQAAQSENGIYIIQASSTPVRATDADTTAELNCAATAVRLGTVNKSRVYLQTTDSPTVGASSIVWARIDGSGGDIRSDGTVAFAANESMGNNNLINVKDPINPQDAATKAYVDSTVGYDPLHDPVFWMLMG